MIRFIARTWILGLLLLGIAVSAIGDEAWVTAKYQPVPEGYRYYLTVDNGMDVSTSNYVFGLEIFCGSASNLETPPKWDHTSISFWDVYWATSSSTGQWYDGIAPGQRLSGFNISLPTLVGSLRYKLMWFNGTSGNGLFNYVYPTPVPEPSALVGLMGGLGALGLPMIRTKRKS